MAKKLTLKAEARIAGKLLRLTVSDKSTGEVGRIITDELPEIARKIHEKPSKVKAFLKPIVADVMARRLGCRKMKIKWS